MNAEAESGMDVRIFRWFAAVMVLSATALIAFAFKQPAADQLPVVAASPAAGKAGSLPVFQLTERSGRLVNEADLDGKFVVASFVFTSCGVSCLLVSQQMGEIQQRCQDRKDVQLVSITTDPRSDSPAVLAKFAERFKADKDRWLFLTGEKGQVFKLLEAGFLNEGESLEDALQPRPDAALKTLPLVRRILVLDQSGGIRACVDGSRSTAPDIVMETLEALQNGVTGP